MTKQQEINCPHIWVHRTDGYEEQCTPAICIICGTYGCICKLKVCDYSEGIKDNLKQFFYSNAISGNDHDLERSIKDETS